MYMNGSLYLKHEATFYFELRDFILWRKLLLRSCFYIVIKNIVYFYDAVASVKGRIKVYQSLT